MARDWSSSLPAGRLANRCKPLRWHCATSANGGERIIPHDKEGQNNYVVRNQPVGGAAVVVGCREVAAVTECCQIDFLKF
ncbi:hypothetical protein E2C01_026490 [Portunus trituberculatus]|uniref:Uncharacterized protein n=1 Tax=Portunus trituberculatus TaxID=210409 RepID=A0A5B7EIQ6_PORTR|nr:hypothetical protein [Portunus trituberculatus]